MLESLERRYRIVTAVIKPAVATQVHMSKAALLIW